MNKDQLKLLASAALKERKLKLSKCFDPEDLDSRANSKQQLIFDDIEKVQVRIVTAGNQCLAEGTKIITNTDD